VIKTVPKIDIKYFANQNRDVLQNKDVDGVRLERRRLITDSSAGYQISTQGHLRYFGVSIPSLSRSCYTHTHPRM